MSVTYTENPRSNTYIIAAPDSAQKDQADMITSDLVSFFNGITGSDERSGGKFIIRAGTYNKSGQIQVKIPCTIEGEETAHISSSLYSLPNIYVSQNDVTLKNLRCNIIEANSGGILTDYLTVTDCCANQIKVNSNSRVLNCHVNQVILEKDAEGCYCFGNRKIGSGYGWKSQSQYYTRDDEGTIISITDAAYSNNAIENHNIVTALNAKVDAEEGKGLSTNDYTTAEKTKLAGIAENANNYTHPASHPATMITEDSTHRFVTDAEKAQWNAGGGSGGTASTAVVIGTTASGHTLADCDYLCDGTADDVEIQAAIDALPETGGEVFIKEGTYQITAALKLKTKVKFIGSGEGTLLKRAFATVPADIGANSIICADAPYITLKDFRIHGQSSTYQEQDAAAVVSVHGIYANGFSKGLIENVTNAFNTGCGLYSDETFFMNNRFINSSFVQNLEDGCKISGLLSAYLHFTDCNFSNNGMAGLRLYGQKNVITGCSFENNTQDGLACFGLTYSHITNNLITGIGSGNGIRLTSSSNMNVINSNIIEETNYGIDINTSNRNVIDANLIVAAQGKESIRLTSDSRVNTVVGNSIMFKDVLDANADTTAANFKACNKYSGSQA